MIVRITRDANRSNAKATIGKLEVIEGNTVLFSCACLELGWNNNKTGKSCIPIGEYEAAWTWSPTFKRYLWELIDVPGRKYIRLHVANYTRQLRGCIAPGMNVKDIDGDGVLDVASSGRALDGIHEYTKRREDVGIRFVVREKC